LSAGVVGGGGGGGVHCPAARAEVEGRWRRGGGGGGEVGGCGDDLNTSIAFVATTSRHDNLRHGANDEAM